MLKTQTACCPECAQPLSFRKFLVLNNLSATHCENCKTRIEISNRNANAVIAGVSGCLSAACIVLSGWYGATYYSSLLGGLAVGTGIATLLLFIICRYAYTHARLNRMNTEYRLWSDAPRKKESLIGQEPLEWISSARHAATH